MLWLSLLPPIVLVALLFRDAVDVPYCDEWDDDLCGLFIKLKTSHLTFGDLWAPHNEGRLFLPKIFFLILGSWTHWNVIYEIAATFLVVCLIAYAIYRLEWPAFSERSVARSIIFFVSSILLFSPAQGGALLWGLEIILYVPLLCLVSALLILRSNLSETAKLLYCMVLATIATFSFSNGFLLWFVLFPAVFPVEDWHRFKKTLRNALCWLLAFLGNLAAYFHNLGISQSNKFLSVFWRYPWPTSKYFVAFLGAPLVDRRSNRHLQSAEVIGLVTVILFLGICFWIFRHRKNQSLIRPSRPWLTIGAYGVLSALLAATGRTDLGTEQALSSRYGIFGISLMIALVHLIPILVFSHSAENIGATPRLARPGFLLTVLAVTVILLHALAFQSNTENMATIRLIFRLDKASLQFLDVLPPQPAFTGFHRGYASFKKNADALNNLNVRNDDFVKTTRLADFKLNPQPDCGSIESAQKIDTKIYLAGWALSPDHQAAADCVLLTYEGPGIEPTILGLMDFVRMDLTEEFHSRKYFAAGWETTIDKRDLPRGKLELKAFVYDVQTRQVTPLDKTIEISNL
jgi:hypothetical protein